MVSYIVLEDRLLCMPMVTKIGTFMAYNIEDGPAFEASNGYREWWINGEELTEDEFNSYLAKKSSMNYYNPICKKRRPRCRARSKL